MPFPIYQVIFYVFAAMLIASAVMVITSRNPVRAVLFLVLAFFNAAVLWMLLQAEFIALVLIFVYVGAVMTLFLFVVMMLNVDLAGMKEKFVRFMPIAILISVALIGMMIAAVGQSHFNPINAGVVSRPADYSNAQALGQLLYTTYLYPFEIAALILLVAIIAAISLAFHGRKPGTRTQQIAKQHSVRKEDRLRIIKVKGDKA